MKHIKRICMAAAAAAAVAATATAAWADTWPSKPVRLLVSSTPGSAPDVMTRALAQRLHEHYKQPFVVENRPGANTLIAMQACASAAADGYTFCITTNDSMSLNPHLYNKLPYNADKDFAPVAIIAWPQGVMVANSQLGVQQFKDVVALSKRKPGSLNWGSFGIGSSSHLYLEWITSRTGWDMTHIPYSGRSVVPVVIANEVQVTYAAIGALKPHIDSGKLVPLAVPGNQRSPFLPQVPTFTEVGLGEFVMRNWFGMFAPANVPDAIVQDLNKATLAITHDAAFRKATLDVLTLLPGSETPAEMRAFLVKDRAASAELVRLSKVKLD
jgi:tripartite-type tricarboxylate transporter receptor subunit TctC